VLTASKRFDGRSDSFRTGDLGMIGADGLLHSIGRMDQMVKIRGHRFDLGEIEAAIKAHPDVRDAAAFAFPTSQGETELRAAALSRRKDDLVADLRLHCVAKLPTFARPAHFLPLEEFPLLSTGKIDRRELKALLSTVSGGKPTA
jgi:acyl-CoA synthetase (AMP-forming)/AMP-acid ligase II